MLNIQNTIVVVPMGVLGSGGAGVWCHTALGKRCSRTGGAKAAGSTMFVGCTLPQNGITEPGCKKQNPFRNIVKMVAAHKTAITIMQPNFCYAETTKINVNMALRPSLCLHVQKINGYQHENGLRLSFYHTELLF